MSTPSMDVPSHIDFATEVKADRLSILWKIAAVFGILMILTGFIFSSYLDDTINIWLGAPFVLLLASGITGYLLHKEMFDGASLSFALGCIASVSALLTSDNLTAFQLAPFIFVVVIFVCGLLLSPQRTLIIAITCALLTVLIPYMVTNNSDFLGGHQFFAIALMLTSALLAAQVTGELYAVTEWALMNYQRERRTNLDLFESRLQLQRSLQRSEALSSQLKETNTELERAHREAEIAKNFRGKFLANMSHELRTPLNAIIGFSETMIKFPMMYNDEPLPDLYRKDMGQIFSSGQQLLDVINDILDLARVDSGKLEIYQERVELRRIIDTVLATATGLVGNKPITLENNLPDPLPDVWADENRVRQVLLNLYSNAVKFTEQGSITLKIEDKITEVQFAVSDTGSGIAESKLEEIFEEFRQTDTEGRDPRSGAGLGLAIARHLVTLMGGRIWAESKPGEGSTFYFTLPHYHQKKNATVQAKAISPEDIRRLLDDDTNSKAETDTVKDANSKTEASSS